MYLLSLVPGLFLGIRRKTNLCIPRFFNILILIAHGSNIKCFPHEICFFSYYICRNVIFFYFEKFDYISLSSVQQINLGSMEEHCFNAFGFRNVLIIVYNHFSNHISQETYCAQCNLFLDNFML